ncbi:MAG: iron-sulfur containing oxygenase [Betaproteobacteria bacterium]|nr:iron-sulfur containing oxygenase [Betaproteobacteria bacterium]
MGRLLRGFWQPVALCKEVSPGSAIPLLILSEELTLYRGHGGQAYLIGGRCAHRQTLLYTGWIEGERIRCTYHGWQYDRSGQCTERPAERDPGPPKIKIPGYPLHEYCGLIFAWMGEGPAPEFDLPRKDAFERPGGLLAQGKEKWDVNWFQQIENSLDATHVSFVHQAMRLGPFGEAVTPAIPELSYCETEAGIEQTAVRSRNNVRKSDWTFPNNNHIVVPGMAMGDPWIDVGVWMTPNDDTHATRFVLYGMPPASDEAKRRFIEYFGRYASYDPVAHHDELFRKKIYPPQEDALVGLTAAQDYVSIKGQGTIADRTKETLGRSDLGIVSLRNIFWRELDAAKSGKATKQWRRRALQADLPTQPGAMAVPGEVGV